MSFGQNHLVRGLALAAALGGLGFCGLGCAGFGIFEAKDSPPLPATMTGLHAAIDEQRAKLLNLVSETRPDGELRDDNANQLVAIAERLTQLTAALERLEVESNSETTAR
jgi:hypothetical protein